MTRITIVGGTGYAGSAIAREAAARGHEVRSISRSAPEVGVEGVAYETGSMLDADARLAAVEGSDVVIEALSPRGELDGQLVDVDRALVALAREHGARIGVIGGFSSLRPAPDAPRFAEGDDLPPEFAGEARQMNAVLEELLAADDSLDWFFVSPAMNFGAYAPGEALGRYRVGGDVAVFDADGASAISGQDFALAVVDEIETAAHHRAHFSVAY